MVWSLELIDPMAWLFAPSDGFTGPSKAVPTLVFSEKPFVLLHGGEIRVLRDPTSRRISKVRATQAGVTIITPEGRATVWADSIQFKSGSSLVLLEGDDTCITDREETLRPAAPTDTVVIDFAKNEALCSGAFTNNLAPYRKVVD